MSFLFKKREPTPQDAQSQNPNVTNNQIQSNNQNNQSMSHSMSLDQLSRLGLDQSTQYNQTINQSNNQPNSQPMSQTQSPSHALSQALQSMPMSIPNYPMSPQSGNPTSNPNYPVSQSINQNYNMGMQPMINQYSQHMNPSINQSINQSINSPINQHMNQSIPSPSQLLNQSLNLNRMQMPYYTLPTSPHSMNQSINQSISQPTHQMMSPHSTHQHMNPSINQSMNQPINPSYNQQMNPHINPPHQSINQLNNQLAMNPSINQSINQSISQSMNQPIHQPINPPTEQPVDPIPVLEDTPSEDCLILREHFAKLINQTISQSNNQSLNQTTNQLVKQTIKQYFQFGDTLGTGTFGRVRLVSYFDANLSQKPLHFALKMLKKSEILRLKQVEHIKAEKSILSRCCHPFIVSLYAHFQDERSLYMLMEYVIGGELFSQLRKVGRFSNDTARFYAAEIVLALQYLHSHDIVYRDLKPENLLIDREGHIKITDFGFAKVVTDRTWTLCGTPEYLAPEIIQSKGHGKSVDWWALGILIYEMIAGYPPFYDDNQFQIYSKILAGKIEFPKHFDPYAKDLVKKLLTADRSKRFGCLKDGADDVKRHRWFKGVDWIRVHCRRVKPPYVPGFASPGDTSNFDKYPDSDDEAETPLSQKEKDAFVDF